jgi:hypothetical protein
MIASSRYCFTPPAMANPFFPLQGRLGSLSGIQQQNLIQGCILNGMPVKVFPFFLPRPRTISDAAFALK